MSKIFPASVALATVLTIACGEVDSKQRAVSGTPDQPQRAPADTAAQALPPVNNPTVTADGRPVNAQGAATLEFKKRIDAYMEIHDEADAKVPSLRKTDDPKEISQREKALGEMIMTLRANAQPGDIFAPEYQPYFIKIVQEDFKGRSAADRKALVSELPKNMKVDINTVYPTTLPLATFPPALLRKLPDLPADLEYRIVGRSLLLRDVKANLIVDILRDVVPTIPS
ncbi:MAG TPA: hypothetical protein VFB99_00235 [Vicinamibacterales bacterium]|nr:hypothetical protein [Vicinamibacterales bacterium]